MPSAAHRRDEALHDLLVQEREELLPRVDERDLRAERREHAGVLAADDARRRARRAGREAADAEDFVGVVDVVVGEVDVLRSERPRAGGDQDEVALRAASLRGRSSTTTVCGSSSRAVAVEVASRRGAARFARMRSGLRRRDDVLARHQALELRRAIELDGDAVERRAPDSRTDTAPSREASCSAACRCGRRRRPAPARAPRRRRACRSRPPARRLSRRRDPNQSRRGRSSRASSGCLSHDVAG